MVTSSVLSAVGQVEGFVDQGKIGNDIANNRVFEKWPVLPRRIVGMATPNGPIWPSLQSDHHGPTPSLDEADTKTIRFRERDIRPYGAG